MQLLHHQVVVAGLEPLVHDAQPVLALLLLVVAAYRWTGVSRTLLFWSAFILTRPLGAVVGDFLDKPLSAGGLALSRYSASAALLAFMLAVWGLTGRAAP